MTWQLVYKYPQTGAIGFSEKFANRSDAVKELRRDFSSNADTLDFRIPISVVRSDQL